jgi:hypothetical protein
VACLEKDLDAITVSQYRGVMSKRKAQSREDHVLTTVSLPRQLHRRLAFAAIEDGWAIAEIIRTAVADWLDRRERKAKGKGGAKR